jgi:hypothetical protein
LTPIRKGNTSIRNYIKLLLIPFSSSKEKHLSPLKT